jgi:UDP-GlcNAc:undecaprenyl-phosphate GlcNAc-1-phosphate transferase
VNTKAILGSLITVALAAVLTLVVRRFALRLGFVARPRDDRWHRKPTALFGGVAMFAAFMIGYAVLGPGVPRAYPILAAGTLLFITGLVDDVFQIKPYTKLGVQLIAAAIPVFFGLRLPWENYQAVNDCITIFWLVGITNAINLLDNMDGLAAGISVVACGFLVVTFLLNGQTSEAALPALLGGSALGFLFFNFNPAKIFMGDCGSMFLGFMLAGTALLSTNGRFRGVTSVLLAPVLILMIPIFDTCFVIATRTLSGRPVSQGGRDHTSHRLVALGTSDRRAVVTLYALAAICGAVALMIKFVSTAVVVAVAPGFALLALALGIYLGKVKIYEAGAEAPANALVNAFANSTYKRRIFEVLLDVVLVAFAYYGAYLLRWDGRLPAEQLAIFLRTLPVLIVIHLLFLLIGGVYGGLWKYMGVEDLIVLGRSVLGGTVVASGVVLAAYRFHGPSRGVLLLDGLLLMLLLAASRLSLRLLRRLLVGKVASRPNAKPVLIYGAGDGGAILINELLDNHDHQYMPIGFIDDDARKTGKWIRGCKIFRSRDLPQLVQTYGIDEVLISSVKVPDAKLDYLRDMGIGFKKMRIMIE